jgi:REP element-mobilizing transposase RayT
MKDHHEKYHRRSVRLKGYDYSYQGWYYVTICTRNREMIFGDVVDGKMVLNEFGKIVENTWHDLINHNNHIELDAFVIMPNHIHGIIVINNKKFVGAGSEPAPTVERNRPGLPEIIRQFKTFSARRINRHRHLVGVSVWQRNYYEHIVRNEFEFHRIRQYIMENPMKWHTDKYF